MNDQGDIILCSSNKTMISIEKEKEMYLQCDY